MFSTPNLPVSTRKLATREDIGRWTHLANIKIDRIDEEIELLIGCDVPEVLEPIEIRRSKDGGPYATKTIFGWVVNDPLGRNASTEHITNYLQATDANLENQFKEFCNMEFAETQDTDTDTDKTTLSREDQRALQVMNESVTLKDGHYEVALPWKKTTPNYQITEQWQNVV